MSEPFGTVRTMPKRQRSAPKGYLRGCEVEELLNIGRTTRFEWTHAEILQGERFHPRGHWFYPVQQPALRRALTGVAP